MGMLWFPKLRFEGLGCRKGLRRPRSYPVPLFQPIPKKSQKQKTCGPCPFSAYAYFLKSRNFLTNSNIFFWSNL